MLGVFIRALLGFGSSSIVESISIDQNKEDAIDEFASESPLLAAILGASVFGRAATGGRAGEMVARVDRKVGFNLRAAIAERQA